MAKKSTKKAAPVSKTITNSELETLQGLQKSLSNAINNLANIEIAKYELLQDHAEMKLEMQKFTSTLQENYGHVNISLADGSISEIEKEKE
jgi:uncharacterized membrane protein